VVGVLVLERFDLSLEISTFLLFGCGDSSIDVFDSFCVSGIAGIEGIFVLGEICALSLCLPLCKFSDVLGSRLTIEHSFKLFKFHDPYPTFPHVANATICLARGPQYRMGGVSISRDIVYEPETGTYIFGWGLGEQKLEIFNRIRRMRSNTIDKYCNTFWEMIEMTEMTYQ